MKRKLKELLTSRRILLLLSFVCILIIASSFFTNKFVMPLRNAVSYVVIPIQKGMNNMGLVVADRYETLQNINKLLDENASLQEQVDTLTSENNELKQDSYELSRLRDLYSLDEKYPGYSKVAARVIGSTSNNWYSSFTIDKGSADGIEQDMNVIAGDGLVGIVSEVHDHYSVVTSIIEDNSYVSAMIISTGDLCVTRGDIEQMDSGTIHLENFKTGVTVHNGDKIVTSNISSKYLEGILIGYAKDVTTDSNNLTQSGSLVPAVDFEHLQEVLIITQKKADN